MSERYTKATEDSAANDFFDSGSEQNAGDNEATTMSETQNPTATVSTGNERTIVANETSDWYISIGHLKAVASAFVKAHPAMTLNWSGKSDSELPAQVRYVKALHGKKGDLGKRQREHEGNVAIGFGKEGWYADTFGDELPTIDTEPVDGGELAALETREGVAKDDEGEPTYPEGSTDELGNGLPVLLPVIDGEAMPTFVTDDTLEAALEAVEAIPDEPALAPEPEADESDDEAANASEASVEGGDAAAFFGDDEAEETPAVADGALEGYPDPRTLSVKKVRSLVTDLNDASVVEQMIALELKNAEYEGGRDSALKALKGRRNRLQDSDDVAGTPAEGASEPEATQEAAPEGGSSPEAKAELANNLIASGMDAEKALEQVRNL